MNKKVQKIVLTALLAALVCVATLVIQIPSPLGGYVNLGDALIILASAFLSPIYAFFAAAIGSALADVFLGYMVYAPATFVIKGLMALVTSIIIRKAFKDKAFLGTVVGGFTGEVIMVAGYYVFEGFLYDFISVLVNVPFNAIQGCAGLVLGTLLVGLFNTNKTLKRLMNG